MSRQCDFYYNGKEYTRAEFEDYIKSNPQEFADIGSDTSDIVEDVKVSEDGVKTTRYSTKRGVKGKKVPISYLDNFDTENYEIPDAKDIETLMVISDSEDAEGNRAATIRIVTDKGAENFEIVYKKDTPKSDTKASYDSSMLKDRGLVVTPNFDPSVGLKSERFEDGTLKYAQVFIANKFKVYNNQKGEYEYINLQDFVIPGTSTIDTSKLPEELLSMFSFRIPTSSHQSGTVIEIAGFLPHTVGDLMIVPKDHTVQIGEDFDIDTRNVYQYNYYLTPDGKLKKFDYGDIDSTEKESIDTLRKEYLEAKDALWNEYYSPVMNTEKGDDKLNPISAKLRNPMTEANKETLMELALLQEALDNFAVDSFLKAIFQEQYEFEVYSKDFLKERIAELENQLIPANLEKVAANHLKQEYKEIKQSLQERFQEESSPLRGAAKNYSAAIAQKGTEAKVLENNLISLYKSVFSSPSEDVRQLITKVLSTDFAEDTASLLSESSEAIDPDFSIYDAEVQGNIMKAGADGKLGIGVHSNGVTINSLLQQLDKPLYLLERKVDKRGSTYHAPMNMVLGKHKIDGELGRIFDKSGNRRQSEYLMMSQNSATDNQKLEIMSRRNENAETINVFSTMQMLGLESDGINVEGKELSYASLFIYQPIIREYVDLVKSYKASTTSNKELNPEDTAINTLLSEYKKELEKLTGKALPKDHSFLTDKALGASLDSATLFESITPSKSVEYLHKQLYILESFNKFRELGKTINELQKFVNIENGGLGVSFFDTISLIDQISKIESLPIGSNENGVFSLDLFKNMFGDIKRTSGEHPGEGYIFIKRSDETGVSTYVKPENHYAHKIMTSISMGYNLWSSLFPYDTPQIKGIIESALSSAGITDGTAAAQEFKYTVISEMKEYSLADSKTLFPTGVSTARQDLFFDTEANESLGSYLNRLRKLKHPFMNLPLFKDLSIEINKKDYPTLIKYNTGDMSLENNIRISNLLEGLQNSEVELPSRNGVPMTEAQLLEDFFKYAIIADQGNGATGFRQMFPISVFSKYKVDASLRSKNNINSDRQINVFYNGAIKSLEKVAQGTINKKDIIPISNPAELPKIKKTVDLLNRMHSSPNEEPYFTLTPEGIKVRRDNDHYAKGTFERQFFQHNPELIKRTYKGTGIKEFSEQTGVSVADIEASNVDYFSIPQNEGETVGNYITITNARGEILLFEQYDSKELEEADKSLKYFRRLPLLGVHGMNEYNPNTPLVKKSTVSKYNMKPTSPKHILKPSDYAYDSKGQIVGAVKLLQDLFIEGNGGRYSAMIDAFRPYLNYFGLKNVKIEVDPNLSGAGAYISSTNTIVISKHFLDHASKEQLQDLVMEEVLHFVSRSAMDPYIKFTGFKDGNVTYDIMTEDGKLPAHITSLMTVYNYAFKQLQKQYGKEKFNETIENWMSLLKDRNASPGSLTNTSGEMGMAAYRATDIHEFIAGVFIRDTAFAKIVGKMPYMSSGKSILERFTEAIARLLGKLLPNARENSVSTELASTLFEFLNREMDIRGPAPKDTVVVESKSPTAIAEDIDEINEILARAAEKENGEYFDNYSIEENDVSLLDNEADCIF